MLVTFLMVVTKHQTKATCQFDESWNHLGDRLVGITIFGLQKYEDPPTAGGPSPRILDYIIRKT